MYTYLLGQFNTNYIINKKCSNFQQKKSWIFFLKGNKNYNEIFGNISFVEMESSKLINYSTNMWWSGQGALVYVGPQLA